MSLSDRNLRAPLEQAAEVRREGFTVQPRALAARQVARCRAACPAAHDCCLAGFGVQHSPGHYDVLVPGFAGPRFGFLHAGAPWMGTARALLGDGCALLAAGVLDSDPGAAAGEARHGSAHLLEEPLAGAAASPPHCIAVLIPLVDLGGETNGTAVWPRSHHGGGWSPPEGDGTGDCLLVGRDSASPAALPPPLATGEALDTAAADDACGGGEPRTCMAGAATHRGQAISPALRAGDAGLTTLLIDALRPYLLRLDLLRPDLLRLYLLRPYLLELDLQRQDLLRTDYGSTNYPGDALLFDFRLLHKVGGAAVAAVAAAAPPPPPSVVARDTYALLLPPGPALPPGPTTAKRPDYCHPPGPGQRRCCAAALCLPPARMPMVAGRALPALAPTRLARHPRHASRYAHARRLGRGGRHAEQAGSVQRVRARRAVCGAGLPLVT
jgi:hypothetical protein